MAEKQNTAKNALINALLRIGHGKLDLYTQEGLSAARQEPELLAHFIAWNNQKGKVRDAKVAFPVLSLRGLKKEDADLAENAVAHLALLSPRDLVRAYDYNKELVKGGYPIPSGYRRLLERGIKQYLQVREASNKWFDRVTLQHRASMKSLYRLAHLKPSDRARRILFDGDYPRGSVFAKVAKLREMSAKEAAAVILNEKLPFEVVIGSVAKAKDEAITLALLEGMTGNQVITNTKMLERMGVMKNPVLKAAYDSALQRTANETKRSVETLKAGRAAETLRQSGNAEVAAKLEKVQQARLDKLGGIDGDWLVLGDKSGSMSRAVEASRRIASFIAERVTGKVYLVFFDDSPRTFEVTGKSYAEVLEMTKRVSADGSTSVGCGLDSLLSRNIVVNGIAIVSDGGENASPRFADVYQKYVKKLDIEPTVYFYLVEGGEHNNLSTSLKNAKIQAETFNLGRNVDYYSLPGLVATMKTSRYSLADEIMETPLLTLAKVFQEKEALFA